MKKALLNITVLGIILFFAMAMANAQTPQEIAERARTASVSLTMNNGTYGSGFFVLPGQIATSYHVIEGASSGHVSPILRKDKYSIVGITAIDKDNDLVILKVSDVYGLRLPVGDSEAVKVLDPIYVVGNPDGIEGTVTTDAITNVLEKYLLMSAPISPGSSGGAVLNGSGEVIGIAKGNIPGEKERPNQNLNIAVPSNYLTPLVEKAKAWKGELKPLSVDRVTGTHLIWGPNFYEFTLHNQRNETIRNPDYLVIFKDRKGEIICADRFQMNGIMYAGGVSRSHRNLISEWIDGYDPGESYGFLDLFNSYAGPRTKQLMKSYEIRILDFNIDTNFTRREIPLKGVTGSGFTWFDEEPDSPDVRFSYSLQNHLSKNVKSVWSYVVFYDKDGAPIDESLKVGQEISAMETLPINGFARRSVKRLMKNYEIKIYRSLY